MKDQDELSKKIIPSMLEDIEAFGENKSERDLLIKRLNQQFPNDIGIIVSLMLNYIKLKPGEAFSMDPNEPHAYIYGDCVECMALSDNVIRLGMTPKFKDVKILIETLVYDLDKGPSMLSPLVGFSKENLTSSFVVSTFSSGFKEFSCVKFVEEGLSIGKVRSVKLKLKNSAILVNFGGDLVVSWKNEKVAKLGEIGFGEGKFLLGKYGTAQAVENGEFVFEVAGEGQELSEFYMCTSD